MTEAQKHLPMITKVRIKHFRSIRDAEFTLDPMTVLVGPNSSGKSNLLHVFGFLGDIAGRGLESAITDRGGIDDIGWRAPNGRVFAPEIAIECEFRSFRFSYMLRLARNPGSDYAISEETAKIFVESTEGPIRQVTFRFGKLKYPSVRRFFRRSTARPSTTTSEADRNRGTLASHIRFLESDNPKRLFLFSDSATLSFFHLGHLLELGGLVDNGHNDILVSALLSFTEHAQGFQCYQFEPAPLHSPTLMENSLRLENDGTNLASTLRSLFRKNKMFASELKACLSAVIPDVEDVRVSITGSHGVVQLKHRRSSWKEKSTWFDLFHEADGTIRMLALLTALYQVSGLTLTCIEEPEAGLHPGALSVIADVLKEATLRGQILVTTHSPDLIGLLPIDYIRAVTSEGGSTKVGPIAEHQLQSVREGLFSAGEIHYMEGLYPLTAGGQAEC